MLVVVDTPAFDFLSGVAQVGEPVLIQALIAELPVEALDERVLHGLAGPDEVEPDPHAVGPGIQGLAHELRTVVHDDPIGLASLGDHAVQHPHNTLARQGRIDLDCRTLSAEIIDDVQVG